MKNKTKTYVLLALVVGIWGTIGYKVYKGISPKEETIVLNLTESSFEPTDKKPREEFALKPLVRDPFLGTMRVQKKAVEPVKKKQGTVAIPVVYHGVLSKGKRQKNVYIVSINGKQTYIKIGQEIHGVKLLSANNKRIVVRYKSVNKTISRT